MKIDANKLIEEAPAIRRGLNKYDIIMNRVNVVNVSKDADFQRQFNGFYRIRRNAEWRKIYYDLFETAKAGPVTFSEIITTLFEKTGNIEASFSSKMLATLHPDKPIWDQYVLHNLNLQLTGKNKQERLKNAVTLHFGIEKWYGEFLSTDDAKECIAIFDRALPMYAWLSNVKKIDFLLWSMR